MNQPRVVIKPNPNNQAELIKALRDYTAACNQLVGAVGGLLAHIEGEQRSEDEKPSQRYMDGTPKG